MAGNLVVEIEIYNFDLFHTALLCTPPPVSNQISAKKILLAKFELFPIVSIVHKTTLTSLPYNSLTDYSPQVHKLTKIVHASLGYRFGQQT